MHFSSYTANTDGDSFIHLFILFNIHICYNSNTWTSQNTSQILLSIKLKYQSVHPYKFDYFGVNIAMILLLVTRKMSKHSSANPPPPLGHRDMA
jgi:hypothetical protein